MTNQQSGTEPDLSSTPKCHHPHRSHPMSNTMDTSHRSTITMAIASILIFFTLIFDMGVAIPATINITSTVEYMDQYRYDEISATLSSSSSSSTKTATTSKSVPTTPMPYITTESSFGNDSNQSELYTLQLGTSANNHNQHQRQLKHHEVEFNYDYRCPKTHDIHPCDCLELDKRLEEGATEMSDGSGDGLIADELANGSPANVTPTVVMVEVETAINPDHIETVVFCKNIRSVQVLTTAIRGFQGHRVNYFVLDGCKLPSFPNNLFKGIHIVWMEILNSTMQFHDNFFHSNTCP